MARKKERVRVSRPTQDAGISEVNSANSISKRKKKRLQVPTVVDTGTVIDGELPGYVPYFDYVAVVAGRREEHIRYFFEKPDLASLEDAVAFKNKHGKLGYLVGLGPVASYGKLNKRAKNLEFSKTPLHEHILNCGFNDSFAKNICQLFINYALQNTISGSNASIITGYFKDYINRLKSTLTNEGVDFASFTLLDIKANHWRSIFTGGMDRQSYITTKRFFEIYPPTSLDGFLLREVKMKEPSEVKKLPEHASELNFVEKYYSDFEMTQINVLLLNYIQQHKKAIERYRASDNDPTRFKCKHILSSNLIEAMKHHSGMDVSEEILSIELMSRIGSELRYKQYNGNRLTPWQDLKSLFEDEIMVDTMLDFCLYTLKTTGKNFIADMTQINYQSYPSGFHYNSKVLPNGFATKNVNWLSFYTGVDAIKPNFNLIHAWCLVNLLCIVSGKNREVALSIPSRTSDGESILNRECTTSTSVNSNGASKEIELFGYKNRSFGSGGSIDVQHIVISKKSEIYSEFKWYEDNLLTDFDGPFFKFGGSQRNTWSTAFRKKGKFNPDGSIYKYFEIYGENGEVQKRWYTERFRKVFATKKLLNLMAETDDPKELVEKLQKALTHDKFDTTLSSYLMKASGGRLAIDSGIVAIVSNVHEDALKFKGKIEVDKSTNTRKKVFWCECSNPFEPDHNIEIANECKHYDLCLGCNKSVVTKANLPYICLRILQYEGFRVEFGHDWPAMYEDKWMIAHDALSQYKESDPKNGERLINEAWDIAKSGKVVLPPFLDFLR